MLYSFVEGEKGLHLINGVVVGEIETKSGNKKTSRYIIAGGCKKSIT